MSNTRVKLGNGIQSVLTKTQELARFLLGKAESLDFTQPSDCLNGDDDLCSPFENSLAVHQRSS